MTYRGGENLLVIVIGLVPMQHVLVTIYYSSSKLIASNICIALVLISNLFLKNPCQSKTKDLFAFKTWRGTLFKGPLISSYHCHLFQNEEFQNQISSANGCIDLMQERSFYYDKSYIYVTIKVFFEGSYTQNKCKNLINQNPNKINKISNKLNKRIFRYYEGIQQNKRVVVIV